MIKKSQYEKRKAKDESNETPVELKGRAYDLVTVNNRQYNKVTIAYDLETGKAEVIENVKVADSGPRAFRVIQDIFSRIVMGID